MTHSSWNDEHIPLGEFSRSIVHLDLQTALKKQSILAEPNRSQCGRRNAMSLKALMVVLNSVRYLKKLGNLADFGGVDLT